MSNLHKRKNLIVALGLLLAILILKSPILDAPEFWDGIYWMKSAEWISENNFNPILPGPLEQGGLDTGHPTLVLVILAIAFAIFGKSLFIAHLVMLGFAFLTLYFTYLTGSLLCNRRIGIIASVLLLFSPLFFAQSGAVNTDKALAAFTIMTIYFALKSKSAAYIVSGSLLVLSKESGVLTILAVSVYVFAKNYYKPKKELLRKCALYLSPLVVFLGWVVYHRLMIQTGSLIGTPMYWKPLSIAIVFRFFSRVKFFFFDNFHWVISAFMLLSLISFKKALKSFSTKRLILSLTIGFLAVVLFYHGFRILINNVDLFAQLLSSNKAAFLISAKNLKGILLSFSSYNIIFGLFIFAFIFFKGSISLGSFKNKWFILFMLVIFLYFVFTSWTFNAPRYHLPLLAMFFILGAYSLDTVFDKKSYFIAACIVILLVTQWNHGSTEAKGYLLESNMEYLDAVKTHKAMTDYIERHFSDVTILAPPWMTEELRYPLIGYVQRSISPLDWTHYDPKNGYKNLLVLKDEDWYYYQCYLKKSCDINTFIPIGEGDIRDYDKQYDDYLSIDNFDLFYYSPQAPFDYQPIRVIEDFNLTLIKRFEKNGKYAELYTPNPQGRFAPAIPLTEEI